MRFPEVVTRAPRQRRGRTKRAGRLILPKNLWMFFVRHNQATPVNPFVGLAITVRKRIFKMGVTFTVKEYANDAAEIEHKA